MVIGRTFIGWDWYQHQWYIWHQAESIKDNGFPSLFAHDRFAVFNPHFAFYGGTLYAFAAAITIFVGDSGAAMVIVLTLGFAGAYGGWWWLARQAGLGPWLAHAPAVVFVTGPYYLAIIYATGGFGEFMAVSAIPLLLASAFSVLRAERLRAGPAALLAVSVMAFTGSHNLTLAWASILLVIVLGALFATLPKLRSTLTRPGLLRVAGVAIPALMVNAWYLLPDLAYQSHTFISTWDTLSEGDLLGSAHMVRASHVLSPGRASSVTTIPHFSLQLPLLAGAWILVALVVARAAWRSGPFRAVLILLAAAVGLYALMKSPAVIWDLPRPINNIQFSYRIESYIFLAAAGALLGAALLLSRRGGRGRGRATTIWTWALVAVCAWAIGGAAYQLRQQPPAIEHEWTEAAAYYPDKIVPNTWDYSTNQLPNLTETPGAPAARFSPVDAQDGDRATTTVVASPGAIVKTNIITVPELVRLEGGRFVGRGGLGENFVELDDDATPGAAKLTISAARPWPVVGGWILTLLGLAGLAANAVVIARGRGRRGAARRAAP